MSHFAHFGILCLIGLLIAWISVFVFNVPCFLFLCLFGDGEPWIYLFIF